MRSGSGGRPDPRGNRPLARLLALVLALASLAACSALEGPGYLWQSIDGHLTLMWRARPIAEVLDAPATDEALRRKLLLVREARVFASSDLGLPDNGSYKRYSAIDRPFVVWNVFAAPPLSVELHQWCFPVAGCVGYRGYYAEADAQAEAGRLRADGLESAVYPVPAYSTLGWLDWAGGDPLLSTFIRYPEGELARIVFHELAHQVVYVPGDTEFNESFATAVERLGGAEHAAA